MTERVLTIQTETAAGIEADGFIELTPIDTRSSDPILVTAEKILYNIVAGVLVRDTGAVDEDPPTIWSPGNYRVTTFDANRKMLESYPVAVEESALPISINELYRQAAGAAPVVDDQPLYTGDDVGRLRAAGGVEGQALGIGPGGTIIPTDAGSGNMNTATYDPNDIGADVYARANQTGTQPHTTVTGLGNAATKNTGTAPGTVATGDHTHADKADLVGGVIPTAQIPAIAITSYLGSVASQAAMLALAGQEGDWALRSDLGTTWIITGADPTQLSSWQQLNYPTAPVTSVNAQTGTVVLGKADVGLGNAENTSDAAKPISTATQSALDLKAPLASPTFTGIPTVPTAAPGTNTTQAASTAFAAAGFAELAAAIAAFSPGADIYAILANTTTGATGGGTFTGTADGGNWQQHPLNTVIHNGSPYANNVLLSGNYWQATGGKSYITLALLPTRATNNHQAALVSEDLSFIRRGTNRNSNSARDLEEVSFVFAAMAPVVDTRYQYLHVGISTFANEGFGTPLAGYLNDNNFKINGTDNVNVFGMVLIFARDT